uniref:Uncharacterized protein n=1 Tax=Pyricularia oryzae (strain P131) TaxID=1143193 RepID=L7JM91_PYRO1
MVKVKAVLAKIGHIISAQLILIAFGIACLLAYFFPASNVVFTRNAGGEDAAAIVEVVIGNVFGAFVSPALVYAFMPKLPEFDEWQPASPSTLSAMYQKVAQQLGLSVLIPLAVGQVLRFFFPRHVKWALEKLYLGKISTICLALLVWTTFCGAFATGALYVTPKASLIFNIFMNIGLYLLFTVICFFSARPPLKLVTWAEGIFEKKPLCRLPTLLKRVVIPKRMSKEQTIAVCFCGAAKTTSLGIPLVTAMWNESDNLRRAFIQIPVLLYTIEQVFIAQILVYFFRRYMKRDQKDSGTDEDTVADPAGNSLEDARIPSVPVGASEKPGTQPSPVETQRENQPETTTAIGKLPTMNSGQLTHLRRQPTAYCGRIDRDFGVSNSDAASDTITCIRWAPSTGGSGYRLASTSWDGKARIYDISNDGSCRLGAVFGIDDQPLFTCAWNKVSKGVRDEASMTAAAGADNTRRAHQRHLHARSLVAPGPDPDQRVWDLRSSRSPVHVIPLPERATALASAGPEVLIATADRAVHAVDLVRGMGVVQRSVEAQLHHGVTALAVAADHKTWAVGGIEGRVGVDSLSVADQRFRKFSFKAHRDPRDADGEVKVWTINDVCFNPRDSDVLSTAASDGTFVFWDIARRLRLCTFPALQGAITATSFSPDGRVFAYAVGYDWSRGYAHNHPEYPTKLMLHPVEMEELGTRLSRLR